MRTSWAMSLILGGAIVLAPAVHAGESGAKTDSAKGVSESDRKFVMEAAQAGIAEVEMGKLASKKGSSEKVRDFGERMVKDHSKANAELKKLAEARGLKVPAKPSAEHQRHMAKLQKLSGTEFDKEYMEIQHHEHEKAVELFQKQAQAAGDPGLMKFASSTLPTLERHKKMVDETHGKSTSTGGRPTTGGR